MFNFRNGVSRTGPFITLFTSIQDVDEGRSFPDLNKIIRLLRSKRRHIIQDMNQLKFVYETLLYYVQELLVKRKISAFFLNKLFLFFCCRWNIKSRFNNTSSIINSNT